jgi:hypothetical protein
MRGLDPSINLGARGRKSGPTPLHTSWPGRWISLSGVILGLDPRIFISVHRAELSRTPGATDARVNPEHDAERAIPTHRKDYPDTYAACPAHPNQHRAVSGWPGDPPNKSGEGHDGREAVWQA